jgi:hypothetical protein
MITIEITDEEARVLEQGVELWEKDPQNSGLIGSVFGAMLCGRDESGRAEYERTQAESKLKQEREVTKRKATSLRLRAKLMEAIARPVEFSR